MERFNALGRGTQLMLIGAVLLLIDMLLPLAESRPRPLGDFARKRWHGASGAILGILTIVLLAWLIVRLAAVDIPIPVSTAMSAAVLGVLILIFAILKLLASSETTRRSGRGSVVASRDRHRHRRVAWPSRRREASTRSRARRAASESSMSLARPLRLPPRRQPRRHRRRLHGSAGSRTEPPAARAAYAPSGRGGCGLGRNERRAVDRAGARRPARTRTSPRRREAPRRRVRSGMKVLQMPHLAHSRVP